MTPVEKLREMEALWGDLTKNADERLQIAVHFLRQSRNGQP